MSFVHFPIRLSFLLLSFQIFLYSTHKFFAKYVVGKYFLLVCNLSFYSLKKIFHIAKDSNFDEVWFFFSHRYYVFGFVSNTLKLALCPEDFPLRLEHLNIYLIQRS